MRCSKENLPEGNLGSLMILPPVRAIPDILVFEGERVPLSRNALKPGTRPLQLLPLPGSDFPVRPDTDAMRGFQSERHAGGSCVTQLFYCEQLRDATVRSYATPLSLDFDFASLLLLPPWEGDAWAAYPPRALAEALIRSRVLLHGYWLDRYYLGERFLEIHVAIAQRRVPAAPPRHMCILEGMTPEDKLMEYDGLPADVYLIPGDYASYLTTRLQARLPEVREYSQAEADALAGPTGVVLGDVPFPPGMEVALDPTLGLRPAIAILADLRQAPPQLQLDPEHATHVPAQRYQELYQQFCFARSYIARLYLELHERELEIGRLRRHQSHQAGAVSRLQLEVARLWTRLEVEGIPLDFSEEEEDDDEGSSSDDAPKPPPSFVGQAAASPSRRRR
ncbi:hypothetical protein JCGZ_01806 [Jatropha curcas]|uniref:Aminotransferase-like plant mobile domain-containing protein n=1 Tax=Jatropha curcas TaxID=180498 RepID=A0A067JG96_JATCU|nr:hypothetical protein JCGZ_01806 [Jatropha curcas]